MNDFFNRFFLYDAQAPMIFSTWQFWLFFTVLIGGYGLVYRNINRRNAYLMVFSIFFYYKTGGLFVFLLLLSVISDYFLARFISRQKTKSRKKLFLTVSVFLNLLFLSYFKYSYFIIGLLNQAFGTNFEAIDVLSLWTNNALHTHFNVDAILLPVGISFYTFQSLSYTIDVYRGEIEPVKNVFDYAFFVTFFPQLVAGPIVRATEFIPQIYKKFELNKAEFGAAVFLILGGLVKKLLISDYISVNFVDRVFDNPLNYSGFENLMAVYGYAIQIYCDFSGYTDIAIGLAQLLGFRLTLNFNAPYLASSITDFWRRWHISLSTWLKDYLYVSLGGNRKGKFRTYLNLLITMLLGGLWHGASLRFIIWGGLHGMALVFDKMRMSIFGARNNPKTIFVNRTSSFVNSIGHLAGIALTFHFVCFCWIFFRADDMSAVGNILSQIAFRFHAEQILNVIIAYKLIFSIILLTMLIHFIPKSIKEYVSFRFSELSVPSTVAIITTVVFVLYQFHTAQVQPFIYFQF